MYSAYAFQLPVCDICNKSILSKLLKPMRAVMRFTKGAIC